MRYHRECPTLSLFITLTNAMRYSLLSSILTCAQLRILITPLVIVTASNLVFYFDILIYVSYIIFKFRNLCVFNIIFVIFHEF